MKLFALVLVAIFAFVSGGSTLAQQPPYDVYPDAEPPYYRVRYEASSEEGQLDLAVKYTVWMPPGVDRIRGVVVHQHGCGEGSCKSGLTGAYDLHWQALARKHGCALLAASYEQPQSADCARWCDPRNGSDARFRQALADLSQASGHPELTDVPWALWGHSGGGVWSGIMTLLHPDKVAATWLRSGVPLLQPLADRPTAKIVKLPSEALPVPIMINLGTEEGYSVTDGRFSTVWPRSKAFFLELRRRGTQVGIAIDPLTSHQCGNQRYLAIPWFDACLKQRLPKTDGDGLQPMTPDGCWLAALDSKTAVAADQFRGDVKESVWLPNERVAQSWMSYVTDTKVADVTDPPAVENVAIQEGRLTWDARADLESGIRQFLIFRDGKQIGAVPEEPRNRFGRPLFQGLQYSDTPLQPLVKTEFYDEEWGAHQSSRYAVVTVNTVGRKSQPTAAAESAVR